ncbi:MAG: hypothetical protein E7C36_13575 [Mixta calida]|uniref:hypothetical protein n=2 Tax=Erwiniaceae TaxID=1903409 RepID=UPI001054B50A|nr:MULTISPECIES: hypothetical protein [Mixta]MBS6057165.1 hypothetical protein [Pantoea sp.]MCR1566195.1 hypothetical protein [Mixta sp.]MDU2734291.1 hypothetical protein [Mixta calida]MDU3074813.1 hypothetical protein [Mixta calida]MDU4290246.1 hypothetical protein [Mixta calida]
MAMHEEEKYCRVPAILTDKRPVAKGGKRALRPPPFRCFFHHPAGAFLTGYLSVKNAFSSEPGRKSASTSLINKIMHIFYPDDYIEFID